MHCLLSAGSLLATASLDSTVRVWRVSDGACVQTLEGPGDGVEWLTWHPKGDVVLAGSEDFTLWMWLAQSGNCMQVGVRWTGAVCVCVVLPALYALHSARLMPSCLVANSALFPVQALRWQRHPLSSSHDSVLTDSAYSHDSCELLPCALCPSASLPRRCFLATVAQ